MVKSVNNIMPDENGNVEIIIPDISQNIDLTGYATEQYVKDYAQEKGDYLTVSGVQKLTEEQRSIARENIGAVSSWHDLTDRPIYVDDNYSVYTNTIIQPEKNKLYQLADFTNLPNFSLIKAFWHHSMIHRPNGTVFPYFIYYWKWNDETRNEVSNTVNLDSITLIDSVNYYFYSSNTDTIIFYMIFDTSKLTEEYSSLFPTAGLYYKYTYDTNSYKIYCARVEMQFRHTLTKEWISKEIARTSDIPTDEHINELISSSISDLATKESVSIPLSSLNLTEVGTSGTSAILNVFGLFKEKYQVINIYNDTNYRTVLLKHNDNIVGNADLALHLSLLKLYVRDYIDENNYSFDVYHLEDGLYDKITVVDGVLDSAEYNRYAKTKEVLLKGNRVEYIPNTDYSPATKKYVDDAVASFSNSSALPEITTDDNGKILTVLDGEWAASNMPESGISITLTKALSEFFTNIQTLLPQLAYVQTDHIGETLVSNAKTLVKILNDVPLTNLAATYSGGYVTIGTDLDNLRKYITVTGTYSDGTAGEITEYELDGTIIDGESTLTITSGDVSTTITVIGTPNTYLFSNGFEYPDITGGWVNEGNIAFTDYATASKDNNMLNLSAACGDTKYAAVNTYATKNPIDLTKYSKFVMDGEFTTSSANGSVNVRGASTLITDTDFNNAYGSSVVLFNAEKSTTTNGVFETDLSNVDFSAVDPSKMYIALGTGIWAINTNASCKVRNIYLVP